ncbi:TPA: hypothetical protein EYP83_03915 [Candidatus Geothermarchaeota archaeon]|nr:hypothetical protein [Candidatus Geothermarchaeota archaeon]HIQ12938.1 hypothetical protein [Thermoprotei archaeon]
MEYQTIRYGEPFQIRRRLGNLFKDIVRIKGVEYERGKGFIVRDYYALTNLNKILIRMGLILTPMVKCVICDKNIECEKCSFTDVCLKDVTTCLCDECLYSDDVVEKYLSTSRGYFEDFRRSI